MSFDPAFAPVLPRTAALNVSRPFEPRRLRHSRPGAGLRHAPLRLRRDRAAGRRPRMACGLSALAAGNDDRLCRQGLSRAGHRFAVRRRGAVAGRRVRRRAGDRAGGRFSGGAHLPAWQQQVAAGVGRGAGRGRRPRGHRQLPRDSAAGRAGRRGRQTAEGLAADIAERRPAHAPLHLDRCARLEVRPAARQR